MNERLRQQMEIPLTVEMRDERNGDLIEHDQVHRTIDALIAQAAMKTRDAVRNIGMSWSKTKTILFVGRRSSTEIQRKFRENSSRIQSN